MNHFESHRLTFLTLLAVVLAQSALGCSSDDNHGPTIGAPSGPVVIVEGGGSGPTGSSGAPGSGTTGGDTGVGGLLNPGGGSPGAAGTALGTNPFGTAGALGTSTAQAGGPQVGGAGAPASF